LIQGLVGWYLGTYQGTYQADTLVPVTRLAWMQSSIIYNLLSMAVSRLLLFRPYVRSLRIVFEKHEPRADVRSKRWLGQLQSPDDGKLIR